MEIPKGISGRKSIRAYTDEPLTGDDIETLIRAAQMAPSAGNLQPASFVVVTDRAMRDRLAEAAGGQAFLSQAPLVVVVCAEAARTTPRYGERGRSLYILQDTAAAVMAIMVTATHNGLGTCWVGAFDEGKAAEAVGLPEGIRPVALVPVGHPAKDPAPRPRRPLAEVLHRDRW